MWRGRVTVGRGGGDMNVYIWVGGVHLRSVYAVGHTPSFIPQNVTGHLICNMNRYKLRITALSDVLPRDLPGTVAIVYTHVLTCLV